MYRVLRNVLHLRRSGPPTTSREKCTVPRREQESPLQTELLALRDHAQRIPWLASREIRPEEYQGAALEVVAALLAGWHLQHDEAVLADLIPRPASSGGGSIPAAQRL